MVYCCRHPLEGKNGKLLRIWEGVGTCVNAEPNHAHRIKCREEGQNLSCASRDFEAAGQMHIARADPRLEEVTQIRVSDQRMNIEEGRGLVILEQRTLPVALPLPHPIEEIYVQLPGAEQPVQISVGEEIAAFCKQYPKHALCHQREIGQGK